MDGEENTQPSPNKIHISGEVIAGKDFPIESVKVTVAANGLHALYVFAAMLVSLIAAVVYLAGH